MRPWINDAVFVARHQCRRRLYNSGKVSAETTEDCTNLNMSHNESPSGSQVSHSTSQDNDATEPEECARTRPWTHNNPLLRQLPWPDDEDMDYTPPHSAAADSQTADVDITTPEVADIASRMDMRNPAAQALHKDQQGRGSSLTTLAPHATDAVLPHHSTVQRQQANKRSAGLDSFKLANHDVNCMVQQINQVWERRDASQRQADTLYGKIRQLEAEVATAKQQAATARTNVQMADSEHQFLSQRLEYMLETVSAMLTAMQSVKRQKL
ncbi:MAG: hypothetical protein FRX49_11451 [Trebouxia sp. A1-2]|nr:MAG: hypothetical protein FRX49_11451 [Trebouxia sp. A1-2]